MGITEIITEITKAVIITEETEKDATKKESETEL